MENLLTNSTFIILLIVAMFVICIFCAIKGGKKRAEQANEFNRKAKAIERVINNWEPDHFNYETLKNEIRFLQNMPEKDQERIDVIETNFQRKYSEFVSKDNSY